MRIWTLDEIFRRWPGLGFRIAFETTLPSLAALTWGGKALFAAGGTFFGAITAAGLAFTAVLYVQGQVLRMAKNVRDERDANEFRRSFQTVRQGLEALRRYVEPAVPYHSRDFIADAKTAIESGSFFTGAVLAATAFERAARQCAGHMDIHEKNLTAGLYEISDRYPEYADQLRILARLAHGVQNGNHEGELDRESALELVQSFARGKEILYKIIDREGV